MTSQLTVAFAIAAFCACIVPASAQTIGNAEDRSALSAYAQAPPPPRARTRIRVTPRCFYRTQALDYPAPYECEYPGPGYVRQCIAQLVQQYRPSGTVIVPVTRCWWERG